MGDGWQFLDVVDVEGERVGLHQALRMWRKLDVSFQRSAFNGISAWLDKRGESDRDQRGETERG